MTYRFKLLEPIGEGVRRIALEQLETAEAKLSGKENISAAIHDTRRCLKRTRALLRLAEPGLEDDEYQNEAERLSGAGRLLSGARDLDVVRQTLTKLQSRFAALPAAAVQQLGTLASAGHSTNRRAGAAGRRQVLARLAQSKRFFDGKSVARIELGHLIEGMGRTYRKARKAFHAAYEQGSEEAFHAWRKRIQLHWRQMALLSRAWPEALSARASEAKELSRLLGEDHDYAVLLAMVRDKGASLLKPEDLKALTELCRSCQCELRSAAEPRGKRLLMEPVKDLERRVTLYWETAERLVSLGPSAGGAKPTSGSVTKGARYRKR